MAKANRPNSTELAVPPMTDGQIAVTPDRPISVTDDADYQAILDLETRWGAIDFPGASRVDKLNMIGVPFIITGVRFQRAMPKESGGFRDYVTLAAFVADEDEVQAQLDRGRVLKSVGRDAESYTRLDELSVKPRERIIINDGSTGVRRQVVALLNRFGLITVGHEELDARRFDLAWNEWEDPAPLADEIPSHWTTADGEDVPAFGSFPDGRPLIVRSPRGLHGNTYKNEFAPSGWATTFYVA